MYHLDVFRLRRHLIIHLPRLNMDLFTKLNIVHAVVLQSRYIRVRFWCGETLSVTHKERRGDLVTPKSKSFQFKMLKSSLPKVLPTWNPSLQLPHKTIQNLSCSAIDKSTKVYNSSYLKQKMKKKQTFWENVKVLSHTGEWLNTPQRRFTCPASQSTRLEDTLASPATKSSSDLTSPLFTYNRSSSSTAQVNKMSSKKKIFL